MLCLTTTGHKTFHTKHHNGRRKLELRSQKHRESKFRFLQMEQFACVPYWKIEDVIIIIKLLLIIIAYTSGSTLFFKICHFLFGEYKNCMQTLSCVFPTLVKLCLFAFLKIVWKRTKIMPKYWYRLPHPDLASYSLFLYPGFK